MSRKTPEDTGRPSGGSGERATALRAELAARGEAEQLLAEASQARRQAAIDADRLIDEAQTLAQQLGDEARADADETRTEAEERAEVVLARARKQAAETTSRAENEAARITSEAEASAAALAQDAHARVEADVQSRIEALRAESDRVFAGLGASFEALRGALANAEGSLDDAGASITGLQEGALGAPAPVIAAPVVPEAASAAEIVDEPVVVDAGDEVAVTEVETVDDAFVVAEDGETEDDRVAARAGGPQDARPLGWLFRSADS